MSRLPVLKAVGATFAFVMHHWRDVLKIIWAPVVLLLIVSFAIGMTTANSLASSSDPTQAALQVLPASLALLAVVAVYYLLMYAGLLRLVIRGERPKLPFYLGFGADEMRLLGTFLLLFVIVLAAYFGLALLVGIFAGVGASLGSAAPIVIIIAAVAALCVFFWLVVRLSLSAPATVGLARVGIGPSWGRAKGNVLSLLGYWLIWIVLFGVLTFSVMAVFQPDYFKSMLALFSSLFTGSPTAMQDAAQQMATAAASSTNLGTPIGLVGVVASLISGVVVLTLNVLAGGVAWRLMTDEDQASQF